MANTRLNIDSQNLKELYLNKNLSTYKIGKILNCSASSITNRLIEFKIPIKSAALSRMKYKKLDFDGNDAEKAYMIGFRIGDLNVYRVSENSETIVVRCHTTQQEQVNVISALFSKFGRVDDSVRPNGHYYMNSFLNNSFKFLFPKDKSAWAWVQKPATRFAFIAGYTDAEGNFIINQGRARFKIDSYDKDVLDTIAQWLNDSNISYKMRLIFKKGDKQKIYGKMGIYHGDLWRLNINYADSLEKFILRTMPYLKHSRRIDQAKICLKNIQARKQNGYI